MSQLTVVIITKNEERNIGRALDSVSHIADEIIVVDSYSTDKTKSICEKKGAHFIQTDWKGYAATKNFANSLAKFPYIFSLDADEAVDKELEKAILAEKSKGFSGTYTINRLTNYCGKWIHHSGWYPDKKIRIFPKDKTQWVGEFVHEELAFSEPLGHTELPGHLEHYSYYSFEDHRMRADKYSLLTAQKMAARGKNAGALKPYISAVGRFISMYLLKRGFLDGKMGFRIASISAKSNILKYKELRRLNQQ
ncbi:MAG: glycosyltransferase family 2 protein [Bacteroidetes bacterium]|nr:glycosyltransferase family 2 protein [Bacteroidota bacterium]